MLPYAKEYPHVTRALGGAAREFIRESAGIAAGREVGHVRSIDLHPTVVNVLGIEPGRPVDGELDPLVTFFHDVPLPLKKERLARLIEIQKQISLF